MARFIAKTQQKYTQRGGVRPFGVSSMLAGHSPEGVPQLFLSDPAGTYSSWKANAIGGRNEKAVQEYLQKHWTDGLSESDAIILTVKALLEVVDSGSKNMEVAVMRRGTKAETLPEAQIQAIITEIEREQEEAKKANQDSTTGGSSS